MLRSSEGFCMAEDKWNLAFGQDDWCQQKRGPQQKIWWKLTILCQLWWSFAFFSHSFWRWKMDPSFWKRILKMLQIIINKVQSSSKCSCCNPWNSWNIGWNRYGYRSLLIFSTIFHVLVRAQQFNLSPLNEVLGFTETSLRNSSPCIQCISSCLIWRIWHGLTKKKSSKMGSPSHHVMVSDVERHMSSHLCQGATQFEDPSWLIHQVSGDDNGHFKINDPGGYPNKLLVEYWISSLWGPWSQLLTRFDKHISQEIPPFQDEHDWTWLNHVKSPIFDC